MRPAAMVATGRQPFGQRLPRAALQIFADLAADYRFLVERSIARRWLRDHQKDLSGAHRLVEKLIENSARPRDVGDLHRECPIVLLAEAGAAPDVVEEAARLLLIELMGGLAAS